MKTLRQKLNRNVKNFGNKLRDLLTREITSRKIITGALITAVSIWGGYNYFIKSHFTSNLDEPQYEQSGGCQPCIASFGCGGSDDSENGKGREGDDDYVPGDNGSTGNDDDFPGDDGDTDDDNDNSPECPYNVIENEDLGADWDCEDEKGCICKNDYLTFIEKAEDYSNPITLEELTQQIRDIRNGSVDLITTPIPEDEFQEILINKMNIGFLRGGLNERLLKVTTIRKDEAAEYYERELLIKDPYVGTFKGILLIPKTEGPHPAVVAVHGHGGNANIYKDELHGKEYPSHGYAIFMPTLRVMCRGSVEGEVSREFLLNGFCFQGIKNYEILLGLKYLQYLGCLGGIDSEKIGLIGHSGGSTVCNQTIRTEKHFKASVSDHTEDYACLTEYDDNFNDCTAPAIYPYNLLINDFSTSQTPVLSVPYEYEGAMDKIFNFFNEHLKGKNKSSSNEPHLYGPDNKPIKDPERIGYLYNPQGERISPLENNLMHLGKDSKGSEVFYFRNQKAA